MKQKALYTSLLLLGLALNTGALYSQDKVQKKIDKAEANLTSQDQALKSAKQHGVPLTVVSNVSEQASVEAVLIPASLVKKIFGKEVSENYAVIELIVSNTDSKAALIVQSVFLDYSQWLLSGIGNTPQKSPILTGYQKANKPTQVASIEARLVRGELLDAQQWSARNWTVRSLAFLGSVAAGFQFPFSADVARGIAAFNGSVVTGVPTLWPDGSVPQINRISDFGFQTNKVVPKQASDILVAFFPIDRFLTPTFRKIFLENPATFFVPGELLVDPKTSPDLQTMLLPMVSAVYPDFNPSATGAGGGGNATARSGAVRACLTQTLVVAFLEDCNDGSTTVRSAGKDGEKTAQCGLGNLTHDSSCNLQKLFSRVSLGSIYVVVGGVMSVDVTAVPATIYSVAFKDGNTNDKVWTDTSAAHDATITGVYLSGGTPKLVDESGAEIPDVKLEAVPDGSTDNELHFKMTVTKCFEPKRVFFVVSKSPASAAEDNAASANAKTSSAAPIQSTPFQFPMPQYTCPTVAGAGNSDSGAAGAKPAPASTDQPGPAPAANPPAAPKKDGGKH